MQFSNIFKSLLIGACTGTIVLVVAGPLSEAREECCDPDFFYPCLATALLGCSPDIINLCSYQAEQDCLALCVGEPGATPTLC